MVTKLFSNNKNKIYIEYTTLDQNTYAQVRISKTRVGSIGQRLEGQVRILT